MTEIQKDLQIIRSLLPERNGKKFLWLLGLMVLAAVLEAIGISVIPLYVSLIVEPALLTDMPWIGSWVAELLPAEPGMPVIIWASVALFVVVLLKAIFLTLINYFQVQIVAEKRLALGDRLFRAYQSAPYEWHLRRCSSEMLRNIDTDATQVMYGYVMPFLSLLLAAAMSLAILAVTSFAMPWVVLLVLLVVGGGQFIVARGVQGKLRHIGEVCRHQTKLLYKSIRQGFAAIADAQVIGCQSYMADVHKSSLRKILKAQSLQVLIQKTIPHAIEAIMVVGLLFILLVFLSVTDNKSSVLPMFALIAVVAIRLKQFSAQIVGSLGLMNVARIHVANISRELKQLEEIKDTGSKPGFEQPPQSPFENLALDKVSYAYPESMLAVVKDVSFQMGCDDTLAIVGKTGSGKSTLLKIILGLLKPSGKIAVNGVDIACNLSGWRSSIAYVPQTIYLLDDSVQANIAFGVPVNEVDIKRMDEALRISCLDEVVSALPNGLETIVGEDGERLSGGQRQRIGIARALYRQPQVLIMDEATAALDAETEDRVVQNIIHRMNGRALILVTHHMRIVHYCDQLLVLQEGDIAQYGKYTELARNDLDVLTPTVTE